MSDRGTALVVDDSSVNRLLLVKRLETLVKETDRLDAAQLTPDDVEHPRDYILLGYTIDSRTGLGDFNTYFLHLVDWLKTMGLRLPIPPPTDDDAVGQGGRR